VPFPFLKSFAWCNSQIYRRWNSWFSWFWWTLIVIQNIECKICPGHWWEKSLAGSHENERSQRESEEFELVRREQMRRLEKHWIGNQVWDCSSTNSWVCRSLTSLLFHMDIHQWSIDTTGFIPVQIQASWPRSERDLVKDHTAQKSRAPPRNQWA
jgi:hypothetical protein